MQSAVSARGSGGLAATATLIMTLVLVFTLGALTGVLVGAAPASHMFTGQSTVVYRATPCAPASHPVVWYSARSWGCASGEAGR